MCVQLKAFEQGYICIGFVLGSSGHDALGPLVIADLPTRLYLPVLVRKSAGSTEVWPYFSKYGHRVSRKYCNRDVVASEADRRALMGSYHSLTFAYFKPFLGLKYMAGPDRSKQFVKPMNIDFALKLYRS